MTAPRPKSLGAIVRRTALVALPLAALLGAALVAPATAAPADPAGPAAVDGELLVGYVTDATPAAKERARGRAQARFAEQVVAGRSSVERVSLPQGKVRDRAISELESDPAVAYAEPNWVVAIQGKPAPNGTADYFADGRLWGMYGDTSTPANTFGSQAAEAWARGNSGSDAVYVGVIDEGIQVTHPDLDGNVWSNPFDPVNGADDDGNGYADDTFGWDFAGNDRTVYDGGSAGSYDDHGTHVSGTIGAEAGAEKGVKGVNHAVTLISGKFLGRNGGTLANAVRAVDYFTDLKTRHGLNIVATNNSWGGGGFSTALRDAIVRAARADILFVAAAGNSGSNNDSTPSYPSGYSTEALAGYESVIAVAAIASNGLIATFSQYGATSVDLGAPGVAVWSTTAFNGYSSYSGTSMATPHVTGGAALYAAGHPGASAAQIRSALLAATIPTAALTGKTVTGGRLDVSGF